MSSEHLLCIYGSIYSDGGVVLSYTHEDNITIVLVAHKQQTWFILWENILCNIYVIAEIKYVVTQQ